MSLVQPIAAAQLRPTLDDLMTAAVRVADLGRTEAQATERNRRVSPELVAAMRDAGFYRILQPTAWGGYELDFATYSTVLSRVAQGDGSLGWTLMTGSIHQWLISLFPRDAQEEIWGNMNGDFAAGSYAPSGKATIVDGGYRVSGMWSFASGCDSATWLLLGAMFQQPEELGPKPGFFLVPKKNYRIDDDSWNVAGLSGSGSKDVYLDDVFVPQHRILYFAEATSGAAPGTEFNTNPMYRIPFMACVPVCLVSPVIGMADAAVEVFTSFARAQVTRGAVAGGGKTVADYQTIQLRVGEAAASVDAARALLMRDINETVSLANGGSSIGVDVRIRNRRDHAFCAKLATNAVDLLFAAAGGRSLGLDQPLQRIWRDIHAAGVHISLNWDSTGSMYGQHALGLQPQGQY
jgi:alkylation response protein AidB-like acyl-CoA dehydrogenase